MDAVVPEMAALDREEDRDVGPVPRPQIQYPCHVCRETLLGHQIVQCPGNCTFCIHSNCFRDVNIRNDEVFCPWCNYLLSPMWWYEYHIRRNQYYGEAASLPDEAR